MPRDDDNFLSRICPPKNGEEFFPVHIPQIIVQEDQIEMAVLAKFNGFLRVRGGLDLVSVEAKELTERLANGRLVIDDENAF